jgi:hypothetical protein
MSPGSAFWVVPGDSSTTLFEAASRSKDAWAAPAPSASAKMPMNRMLNDKLTVTRSPFFIPYLSFFFFLQTLSTDMQ